MPARSFANFASVAADRLFHDYANIVELGQQDGDSDDLQTIASYLGSYRGVVTIFVVRAADALPPT